VDPSMVVSRCRDISRERRVALWRPRHHETADGSTVGARKRSDPVVGLDLDCFCLGRLARSGGFRGFHPHRLEHA
jgi:hypothetical protein